MEQFYERLNRLMMDNGITSANELARELVDNGLVQVNHHTDSFGKTYKDYDSTRKKILVHQSPDFNIDKLQGEFAVAYATYFECSTDYLFGLIDEPTQPLTDISKEIGLSPKAIEVLNGIANSPSKPLRDANISVINGIVTHKDFASILLDLTELYLLRKEKSGYIVGADNSRAFVSIADMIGYRLYNVSVTFNKIMKDLMKGAKHNG